MEYLRECWGWLVAVDWEHIGKIAPIFTALIAFAAATVALIALRTQVSIARKRAAIDIFLKTEMDRAMLDAWRDYDEGLKAAKNYPSVELFESQEPKKYLAVRAYLDANELICIGINQKAFDQRVCYGFWVSILHKAVTEGKDIIEYARKPEDGGHTYDHILKVNRRWQGTKWPWQRWRRD